MVLTVPFEGFADTVARMHMPRAAYLVAHGTGTRITAADPKNDLLVQCHSPLGLDAVRAKLGKANMECYLGQWSADGVDDNAPKCHVAAVAYKSSENRPGLWMDVFPDEPSAGEVLSRLYDEFVEADELDDVGLERFIQAAEPNVVILSPEDQERFLARHLNSTAHPEPEKEPDSGLEPAAD